MISLQILQPVAVLMLLTFVVWLRLYFTRIPAMRAHRIHPERVASRAQKNGIDLGRGEAAASDNFMNLFELPVLFYAVCITIGLAGMSDAFYVELAWAFVVLRAAHTAIHLTYNKVLHRFAVYALGGLVLLAMIVRFAIDVF